MSDENSAYVPSYAPDPRDIRISIIHAAIGAVAQMGITQPSAILELAQSMLEFVNGGATDPKPTDPKPARTRGPNKPKETAASANEPAIETSEAEAKEPTKTVETKPVVVAQKYTVEDVGSIIGQAAEHTGVGGLKTKAVLKLVGATKRSEIPTDKYDFVHAQLSALIAQAHKEADLMS